MLFESQILDFKRLLPWNKTKKRKTDMRELMRQKLRIQSEADLQAWSEAVIERIEQLHCFRHARVVMFYYPVHHEVDLRPLLDKYKDDFWGAFYSGLFLLMLSECFIRFDSVLDEQDKKDLKRILKSACKQIVKKRLPFKQRLLCRYLTWKK